MKVALIGASMNETIGATVMSSETPQIGIRPANPKPINAVQIYITLRRQTEGRTAVIIAKNAINHMLSDRDPK